MALAGQEDACAAALREYCRQDKLRNPEAHGADVPKALCAVGAFLQARTCAALKTFIRTQRPEEFALICAKPNSGRKVRHHQWIVCFGLPAPTSAGATAAQHHCKLCNVYCTCAADLQQHLLGASHAKAAASQQGAWCELCSFKARDAAALERHISGTRHKVALLQRAYAAGGAMTKDGVIGGVSVPVPQEVTGLSPGQAATVKLWITNQGAVAR